MSFEQAVKDGDLDVARAMLDESPDTGGLEMAECYADLARAYDREGRHDDAIEAHKWAIELGWTTIPDPRSDIAEFHLRAGRGAEAAATWAELKAADPDDVWLYNAAGLSYHEVGEHELAVAWLGEGIELAMRSGDPERIIGQLSSVRRQSLSALGSDLDELEQRVDPFRDAQRSEEQARLERVSEFSDASSAENRERPDIAVALTWFPAGEFEKAIRRWPSLAEDWADVAHADYCVRIDGHIKWLRRQGAPVRAVAPLVVEEYVAWCAEREEDPEQARAAYAAHRMVEGEVIAWPPGRNEPCWCGSGRKYKKCCSPAPARPMHDQQA